MNGAYGEYGERRVANRVLVESPKGKRLLGRRNHRWKDNVNMDLEEVGKEGMGRIDQVQDRDRWGDLVDAVKNFRAP
jgi:hypothetical protein